MGAALFAGLLAAGAARAAPPPQPAPFDVIITHGRVIDGSGNPWFAADIGVRDGRIAAVGALGDAPAKTRIDAHGAVVAPGFIDIHSHADDTIGAQTGLRSSDVRRREARNIVTQGVTTLVANPDGLGPIGLSVAAQAQALAANGGVGPNVALMAPHNAIRLEVMKNDYRRTATPAEIAAMRALVRRDMEEGAFGLTSGLEYTPGRWSDTEELVALAQEIAPYRGVHISHIRSEADAPMWYIPSRDAGQPKTVFDAISETIAIAERTHTRGVVTHIKARGAFGRGRSGDMIALIDAARDRGVEVYADQYPYDTSGSDGKVVLIPGWALGAPEDLAAVDPVAAFLARPTPATAAIDRKAALRATLGDPEKKATLIRDIEFAIAFRGGAEHITVFDYPDRSLIGRTLAALATARGLTPAEMAIALQLEGSGDAGGARLRSFSLDEADIDAFAGQEWTATASDGGVKIAEDGPTVHARYYGTFPRKFARYVRERHALTLEHAVRASTSLPAQIMGFTDRGLLRVGMAADIVVFDPARIADTSDFTNPHQYARGVQEVLVNGVAVVADGRPTGARPGQVLRRR